MLIQKYQNSIEEFLNTESSLQKIIIIYGPTASGKTSFSVELAHYLHTEILSADSRQIYRLMNIGTAKVTEEEKQGIPHHMLDVIDPSEKFSVVDFINMSLPIIGNIQNGGKIPIICG